MEWQIDGRVEIEEVVVEEGCSGVVEGCVDVVVAGRGDAFMKAGVASSILRAWTLRAMSLDSSHLIDLNLWRR